MIKYIVWGLGYEGKWFIHEMNSEEIAYIIDNNSVYKGEKWNGIPILSWNEYTKMGEDYPIVVSAIRHWDEIYNLLLEAGYKTVYSYAEIWIQRKLGQLTYRQDDIFLMNIHSYTNAGDYAITYAEEKFLRDYFTERRVLKIPSFICRDALDKIDPYIKDENVILISGGGYSGNLWMECGEENVRAIIRHFSKNKIVVLPQSLYFTNDNIGQIEKEKSAKVYTEHSNLCICLRDEKSFLKKNEMKRYEFVEWVLIPDMVLYMAQFSELMNNRCDITICFRNDKENNGADIKTSMVQFLEKTFRKIKYMSMETVEIIGTEEAKKAFDEKLQILKKSKLVITDRLHCMILCAISGTPCLALDNVSGKVEGGYAWISYLEYIQFAKNEKNWKEKILYLYNINHDCIYNNYEFVKRYARLEEIIRREKGKDGKIQ